MSWLPRVGRAFWDGAEPDAEPTPPSSNRGSGQMPSMIPCCRIDAQTEVGSAHPAERLKVILRIEIRWVRPMNSIHERDAY